MGIQLLEHGQFRHELGTSWNSYGQRLKLPRSTRLGLYQLLIYNMKEPEKLVVTNEFVVRREFSTVIKMLPLAGVALVATQFPKPDPREPFLPDPIKPGN